jgi:hypothetical protein
MKTRILPREEYPRLDGTELEALWSKLPQGAHVLVVEDKDGKIVGTWCAYTLVHAEGVWVAEEHRAKAAVARSLMQGMAIVIREAFNAAGFMTGSMDNDVAKMLLALGAIEIPGRHFTVPVTALGTVEGEQPCLPQ